MDPMTMMAIANIGMQMMNKGGQQQGGQSPQGQQQQPAKPFMPAPLPPVNATDYGSIINQMMGKQQNQMPGMTMPGQGQSF